MADRASKPDLDAVPTHHAETMWEKVAYSNNLFRCSFATFRKDYCPSTVTEEDINNCIAHLLQPATSSDGSVKDALLKKTGDDYEWTNCRWLTDDCEPVDTLAIRKPKKVKRGDPKPAPMPEEHLPDGYSGDRSPIDAFKPLYAIMQVIYSYGADASTPEGKTFVIKQYPHELRGHVGYHISQGCLAERQWDTEMQANMNAASPEVESDDGYRDRYLPNYEDDNLHVYNAPTASVVVPIACSQQRDIWTADVKVREVMGVTAQHILNVDLRRMWIFALNIEHHSAIPWIFTRTHMVRVNNINWVKDVRDFVCLILTLARASPQQLGIDPDIHRIPGTHDFIYRVKNMDSELVSPEIEGQPSPVPAHAFYKTVEDVVGPQLFCLAFKTTRIIKVVQVHSFEDPTPVPDHKIVILKELWVEEGMPTEAENQDRMFAAVDAFIAQPGGWKNDRRLKDFTSEMLERLEYLFTDKRYRSLFLKRLHAWKGATDVPLSPDTTFVIHNNYFGEPIRHPPVPEELYIENQRCRFIYEEVCVALDHVKTTFVIHNNYFGEPIRHPPVPEELYIENQRCRFIYEEVCVALDHVKTIGEVMNIIQQTATALQVLFCAGWVHRDISAANIMAFRASEQDQWAVKLADFEFAKALTDEDYLDTGDRPVKVGTYRFMPTEISKGRYLFLDHYLDYDFLDMSDRVAEKDLLSTKLGATGEAAKALSMFDASDFKWERGISFESFNAGLQESDIEDKSAKEHSLIPLDADFTQIPTRKEHIVHNYQHDLESLWWILLWFIIVNVKHSPSIEFAGNLFNDTNMRANLFEYGSPDWRDRRRKRDQWILHPDLNDSFSPLLTKLRRAMLVATYIRPMMGQLKMPSAYSAIHTLFARELDELNSKGEKAWESMPVRFNSR